MGIGGGRNRPVLTPSRNQSATLKTSRRLEVVGIKGTTARIKSKYCINSSHDVKQYLSRSFNASSIVCGATLQRILARSSGVKSLVIANLPYSR